MKQQRKYYFLALLATVAVVAPVIAIAAGGFNTGIADAETARWLPTTSINAVLKTALLWLLKIIGIISVMFFAISGIMYLTSAGDTDQADKAKKTAKYALIGTIVALSGIILLEAVTKLLKGQPF